MVSLNLRWALWKITKQVESIKVIATELNVGEHAKRMYRRIIKK